MNDPKSYLTPNYLRFSSLSVHVVNHIYLQKSLSFRGKEAIFKAEKHAKFKRWCFNIGRTRFNRLGNRLLPKRIRKNGINTLSESRHFSSIKSI